MRSIDERIITKVLDHYIYLHQHPELSFQENLTCQYICQVLDQLHIPYEIVGKTGVIGFLESRNSKRTIALRADIDALPLNEDCGHRIKSVHPNVMHACGHDLHTACLLGAAEFLKCHENTLPHNIMLVFQHAEEVLPGGAIDILSNPFFKSHWPEWIIAQHAEPDLPVGTLGLCPGQYMASGDEIYITLYGPGGHAAFPDKSADLVLIAAQIIVALQQITSRQASPLIPTVLTFGNIRCHSAMNIIPQEIVLEGTLRTFDETWRQKAKEHILRISSAMAESMGAQAKINMIEGYPSLFNDPEKAEQAIRILKSEVGNEQVILLPKRMTTEDFARYSQVIPATFFRLGVKGEYSCGKLHTPQFCADPKALEYGTRTLCALAIASASDIANF